MVPFDVRKEEWRESMRSRVRKLQNYFSPYVRHHIPSVENEFFE
jgi:hypothetical protein